LLADSGTVIVSPWGDDVALIRSSLRNYYRDLIYSENLARSSPLLAKISFVRSVVLSATPVAVSREIPKPSFRNWLRAWQERPQYWLNSAETVHGCLPVGRRNLLAEVVATHRIESWPINRVPRDVLDKWLAFLATSDGPNPVRQCPGSLAVATTLDDRIAVELLVVRDAADEIVGIQPIQRGLLRLRFKLSRASFSIPIRGVTLIGTEPLTAEPGSKPFVMRNVLRHLRHERAIEFDKLKSASPVALEVQQYARTRKRISLVDKRGSWTYAPVPRSLEIYNVGLGKKKLYNLRRQNRLLADHLGGDLDLVVIRDSEDISMVVAAIRQLTTWSGVKLKWAEKQAELACRESIACFFILKCNDRLVALVRATAWGDQLHIHSMHRDESLDRFSPGTAQWQAILKWLIEGGEFKRILFNYGTPAPGNRAINVTEDRLHVFVLKIGIRASLAIGLHRIFAGGKMLRNLIRSVARARLEPEAVATND